MRTATFVTAASIFLLLFARVFFSQLQVSEIFTQIVDLSGWTVAVKTLFSCMLDRLGTPDIEKGLANGPSQ